MISPIVVYTPHQHPLPFKKGASLFTLSRMLCFLSWKFCKFTIGYWIKLTIIFYIMFTARLALIKWPTGHGFSIDFTSLLALLCGFFNSSSGHVCFHVECCQFLLFLMMYSRRTWRTDFMNVGWSGIYRSSEHESGSSTVHHQKEKKLKTLNMKSDTSRWWIKKPQNGANKLVKSIEKSCSCGH